QTVDLERVELVDRARRDLAHQLGAVGRGEQRNTTRGLGRLVQAVRRGLTDVDPREQQTRPVTNRDRWLVSVGETATAPSDALFVGEAVREQARQQIARALRWVLRERELERLVHAPI